MGGAAAGLAQIAGRPGLQQALGQGPVLQHRHDDHPHAQIGTHDALGHLQPAVSRQVQVAQHHVGLQLAHQRQCRFAGLRLAHHFDVCVGAQDQAHAGAHQGVVVDQENADGHGHGCLGGTGRA